MSVRLAVIKETAHAEARVAATPETVKKLIAKGFDVTVESGAGAQAAYPDKDYAAAGAQIAASFKEAVSQADIVLCVQPPADVNALKSGAVLIGLLSPYNNRPLIDSCAKSNIVAMAMEMVPRTTRAQAMDVLSSQSNLAGYRAVIEASNHFTRAFPMMMTAAGTVPPARVFVMGAGVAGLQAIATAKRLGAIVSATDVRPVAKEQVQSLGGTFVMVESDEMKAAETSGGYAREMSDEFKRKQAALIADTIVRQDIVITTALIPGKPAPLLVTEDMLRSMKPGAIVVDMAVEQGGNVALSKAGEIVKVGDVSIIGFKNLPSRIATDSSALYARNLLNLLTLMLGKDNAFGVDLNDDIIKAITLTSGGSIIHSQFVA